MTASKTANLGLMNPVGSDPFLTTDFAQTMGIIDQNPGILVVPNAASRPTSWSASQHGRRVWQADLNIQWVWVQPSSLTAGSWSRVGNVGLLGSATNMTVISTSAVNTGTAPTVVSVNCMVPGGRPVMVMYNWIFIGNGSAKQATLNHFVNSSNVLETRHLGNSFAEAYLSGTPYPPYSSSFSWIRNASGAQENLTFSLKLRCQDPAFVGGAQGGGTSFIDRVSMYVIEI